MASSKNEVSLSLSKSIRYQNALRTNNIEHLRMKRKMRNLQKFENRREEHFLQSHNNLFEWVQTMRTTTGTTFPEHPDKIFLKEEREKNDEDVAPSYYFAYGMRIGERPQLLKNFLGKKPKSKRPQLEKRIIHKARRGESAPAKRGDNEEIPKPIYSYFANKDMERKTDRRIRKGYKTFMFENKIVTQVPIGYSRECRRPQTCYSPSSSDQFKPENTILPPYYYMKYHGLLPPVDMFR